MYIIHRNPGIGAASIQTGGSDQKTTESPKADDSDISLTQSDEESCKIVSYKPETSKKRELPKKSKEEGPSKPKKTKFNFTPRTY